MLKGDRESGGLGGQLDLRCVLWRTLSGQVSCVKDNSALNLHTAVRIEITYENAERL